MVRALARRGDRVTVLTRNPNKARNGLPRGVRAAAWHPQKAGPWQDELGVVDAVVHLAGDPVAQRWTEATKKSIKASRVESTKLIVDAIAKRRPRLLIGISAKVPDLLARLAPANSIRIFAKLVGASGNAKAARTR